MVFCNVTPLSNSNTEKKVTILILIDGFLQFIDETLNHCVESHNPYFNRWFSAINEEEDILDIDGTVTILILIDGFLQ